MTAAWNIYSTTWSTCMHCTLTYFVLAYNLCRHCWSTLLYQPAIINWNSSECSGACKTCCILFYEEKHVSLVVDMTWEHQLKASNVPFISLPWAFFLNEKGSSCPIFPRVADTNEQSFITVIKPAGRLFLQVAVLLVNDRPSEWGMDDFQVALWAALRSHDCISITRPIDLVFNLRIADPWFYF